MPARRDDAGPPDGHVQHDASLAGLQTTTDPVTSAASYPTMGEDTASLPAPPANPSNITFQSSDLLLTDVVSFEVRMLFADGTRFESLYDLTDNTKTSARGPLPPVGVGNNTAYPINHTGFNGGVTGLQSITPPTGPLVFDTWSSGTNSTSASMGRPRLRLFRMERGRDGEQHSDLSARQRCRDHDDSPPRGPGGHPRVGREDSADPSDNDRPGFVRVSPAFVLGPGASRGCDSSPAAPGG